MCAPAFPGRERLFCALAYTPKATVQAAIGGVPLAMGLACGSKVLAVAVLAILITAPLGALAHRAHLRPRLLPGPGGLSRQAARRRILQGGGARNLICVSPAHLPRSPQTGSRCLYEGSSSFDSRFQRPALPAAKAKAFCRWPLPAIPAVFPSGRKRRPASVWRPGAGLHTGILFGRVQAFVLARRLHFYIAELFCISVAQGILRHGTGHGALPHPVRHRALFRLGAPQRNARGQAAAQAAQGRTAQWPRQKYPAR